MQPQPGRVLESKREHAFAAGSRHRQEPARRLFPAQQSLCAGQPQRAIRTRRDHFRIHRGQAVAGIRVDLVQHRTTFAVAALQAAAQAGQPHAAVGGLHQPIDRPGIRGRILACALRPRLERMAGKIQPRQALAVPEPEPPLAILQHRAQYEFAEFLLMPWDRFDLAGRRIQALDATLVADQPYAAGSPRRDATIEPATKALRRGERSDATPVRTQVAQATRLDRHPQTAIGLPQQGLHQARDAAARGIEVHGCRGAFSLGAPQTALSAQPVFAIVGIDHGDDRVGADEHRRPCRRDPATCLAAVHAIGSAHPQVRPVGDQRIDDRQPVLRERHPAHGLAIEIRQAGDRSDPQHSFLIESQRQDVVRRQARGVGFAGGKMGELPVRIQPAEAAAEPAEPQRIAAAGDGEYIVAAHLRMLRQAVMAKALAIGAHHAQAAVLGGDPDPVAPIDMQGLHDIPGQRGGIFGIVPPHLEADAVVAGQAIVGGDPQVTGTVAGQCGDRGVGQAIGRTQHPEAGDLGHGSLRRDATDKAQPQQPDSQSHSRSAHSLTPCSFPVRASSQWTVACASGVSCTPPN